MEELKANIKLRVKDFLKTVSSKSAQLDYKKAVPFVHIPNELVCQWDDLFSPDQHWFLEIWTDSELNSLTKFTTVFFDTVDSMGELDDVPTIFEDERW